MSQKSIFRKLTALIVAVYMVLGNVSLVGMGFNKAIAEELNMPQITLEQQLEKYVQYNNQSGKGVVLKTKIQMGEDIPSKDQYKVIKSVKLEQQVPEINGKKPERVNVVESITTLTNGKTNGEINQNYDLNSGLLTISYENKDNYSEYKENAKDEFEIIYIYSQEAYTGNETEITTNTSIKAKVEYNEENENVEKSENYVVKLKENVGDIAQIQTVEVSDIYKGYMYSNEENKTTYETAYTAKENIEVLNNELIDKLTVNQSESKLILEEDKEANANIEYKSTTVSEESFKEILGEDGYIDIYVAENKYATVKYAEADKDGNRKYIVEYKDGEQKKTSGKIEYVEGTKEIKIITSNPKTEGKIELLQEKVIKANQEEKIRNIKGIKEVKTAIGIKQAEKEEIKINEAIENKIIELKEPQAQMSLELSSNNLSTLSTNNITATIKLNDTNSSCKLFEVGSMEITLPANLTSAKIISAKSLYENGLSISNAKIENGKIILTIEGKQTAYDTENISGGVNIVIGLELNLDNTTPSHKETLDLTYGNEKVSTDVNIVSKYGMLNVTEINSEASIEKDITKEIDMNDEEKNISIKNTYINNYSENIDSLEIIGKIPSQGIKDENGQELQSTFNTKLLKAINVAKKEVEIYYSEDVNATTDSDTWKKEVSNFSNIKSYKIVLKSSQLKAGEKIEVLYNIQVPADLTYNQITYGTSKISYNINGNKTTETYSLELKTATLRIEGYTVSNNVNTAETVGNLEVTNYMKLGNLNLDSTSILYENQVVKYGIKVKNISSDTISNVTVKGSVPEGTTAVKLKEDNYVDYNAEWFNEYDNKEVSETVSIEAGKTYIMEYYVRINSISNSDVIKITQNFNVSINNELVKSIENSNMVKKADIQVMLTDSIDTSITSLTENYTEYAIKVKNLTENDIKDIDISALTSANINSTYSIIDNEGNEDISKFDLSASETKIFKLKIYNSSFTDNSSLEETQIVYVSCSLEGTTYYSNEISREIIQGNTTIDVELSSNIQEESVYDGTEIIYTIKVTNTGMIDAKADITYNMPEGLKMMRKVIARDNIDVSYPEGEDTLELSKTEIKTGETLEIVIYTKVDGKEAGIQRELVNETENGELEYNVTYYDVEEIESSVYVSGVNFNNVSSNSIKYKVLYNEQETSDEENNENNNEEGNNNSGNQEQTAFSISGLAWLDANKDGQRDEAETLLSGIKATLVNVVTGETVKDSNGNTITVTTTEDGVYSFTGLDKGIYLVVFEFDTTTYTVTVYQKDEIAMELNSDAILSNVTVEGSTKLVGITDNIEITNTNISNIDLGLIQNAKFDLSLDKQISSITVTNAQGTKTTEYNNTNFAKIDLVAKYMNNTNVIVTYKFVIKNEGEVTGYVDRLVDNLPSGLEFSSELNKDWYKGNDGNLYTTSLNGIAIAPEETSEIQLVLTKKTTEETTGTFSNNAEIDKMSNLEAISEETVATENNKSSADLVISIKTGSAMLYIGITIGCLAIIGAGAYIIKKKIINREIL